MNRSIRSANGDPVRIEGGQGGRRIGPLRPGRDTELVGSIGPNNLIVFEVEY